MKQFNTEIPKHLKHILKDILIISEDSPVKNHLPFFADGFPGIVFYNANSKMLIHPFEKNMPELFLFGITVIPITIEMDGEFLIFIIQLYPYVLKNFFDLDPNSLVDDCFDFNNFFPKINLLEELNEYNPIDINGKLQQIFHFFESYSKSKNYKIDHYVKKAITLIIDSRGQESINWVANKLEISKRTIERKFKTEIGITPKQFSKIIKFQNSFQQLNSNNYILPTDIVYDNGYTDQSHFIKSFKLFTKMTPNIFLKSNK